MIVKTYGSAINGIDIMTITVAVSIDRGGNYTVVEYF